MSPQPQLALFGNAMDPALRRATAPDAALLVLAEIGLKTGRYGSDGVPAVGFRRAQLDRLEANGWIRQTRLDDPDVDEGPRRVHLTAAGREQVQASDAYAENWGFTPITAAVIADVGTASLTSQ